MTDPTPQTRRRLSFRPGLATQVLIGFLLGVGVGLFFGEGAAFFETLGMAFIRLLQMTVLPYVVVSLVAGLGRLGAQDAGRLAVRGGIFVVVLWAIGLVVVASIPLAFPDWESAAFFSSSLVEQPAPFNFLDLYFTSNPFNAMAATIVPAVVVFSIALGAALISVKGKEQVIESLSVVGEALSRLSGFVARVAPIGVFGIAAGAAATMEFSDLGRIQVYLIPQALTALVMAFVVLPGLVSVLTPIRPMAFIRRTWGAIITGFATGSLFVVLPLLAEAAKKLLEESGLDREESSKTVDVVVPTTYNFPSTGALLSLCFMFFAGWFIGSPIAFSRYPGFLITGLFSFFGSATLAVPFLLDLLQLPADLFQLYLAVDVIASRFGTLLAAMHVTTLALLASFAMSGGIRLRVARLGPFLGAALGSIAVVIVGSFLYFTYLVPQEYRGYRMFVEMELGGETVPYTVLEDPSALPADPRPVFEQIDERGTLRVCFSKDELPLVFRNAAGNLVGYDVELFHRLADDVDASLEFVHVAQSDVLEAIEDGRCHTSTTMAMTPLRSRRISFATPHARWTAALLVPDHRRAEFSSVEALLAHRSLRIGMPDAPYYRDMFQKRLPQAEFVVMESPRPFLRGEADELDAFVYLAETGSSWTLVYPGYTVAVPKPYVLTIPMAFAVRRGDREWLDYLSVWIELKKEDGTMNELFDRWILGQQARSGKPRWCVIRDVLGWVE
jgi:Na+/H+-dicarboxylate symporter/ABC-type amino acid transport substrate-binding protein